MTIIIILGVIILSVIIISRPHPETPEEVVKCIGKNSKLYVQLGCHACEIQKDIFGKNYEFLTVIDCWFEGDKCNEIEKTPTWVIKGEKYVGIKTIEKLKELTGCE